MWEWSYRARVPRYFIIFADGWHQLLVNLSTCSIWCCLLPLIELGTSFFGLSSLRDSLNLMPAGLELDRAGLPTGLMLWRSSPIDFSTIHLLWIKFILCSLYRLSGDREEMRLWTSLCNTVPGCRDRGLATQICERGPFFLLGNYAPWKILLP